MTAPGRQVLLVTGATGFLGSHFLFWRSRRPGRFVVLVRGEDEAAARARLRAKLDVCAASYSMPVTEEGWDRDIQVVLGDVSQPLAGLTDDAVAALRALGVEECWHFAASLNFEERRRERILAQNVEGTTNTLRLASALGVRRFLYVSTAYTAGKRAGRVPEALHPLDGEFNNLYEQSKCMAEHAVTDYCGAAGLDYRILRPGIVVGPSHSLRSGGSDSGLYGFMRVLRGLREALAGLDHSLTLVGDPAVRIPFVPIDHVMRDVFHLIDVSFAGGPIYHLTGQGGIVAEGLMATMCRHVELRPIHVGRRDHDEPSPLEHLLDRRSAFYGSYFRLQYEFERSLPGESLVGPEDLEGLCLHYAQELNQEATQQVFQASVAHSFDGTPLNVYTCGDPAHPAVLLINAYGMPVEFCVPLARRLASRFHVITWESRGVPNLAGPFDPARCDVTAHARDGLAVLDARGLDAAHVIGWCTGAQVTLKLAALERARTRGLVLLNGTFLLPAAEAPRTSYFQNMFDMMPKIARGMRQAEMYHRMIYGNRPQQSYGALVGEAPSEDRASMTNLLDDTDPVLLNMTSVPFRTPEALFRYANMITRFFQEPDHAWAGDVQNPVLVIGGGHDVISHPDASSVIARRLAHAELLMIPEGDHFGLYNDDQLASAVCDFLAADGRAVTG